ncbi:hypothetical protein PG913_08320 [Tenacibaculum pacificus]|uniref:hypothetical protein n=1 Tax=Tenacibaculum pacificus TaxID=3018314 RepID=UPI0022F38236|nr:hypothetical protein [Tenacibaculum pacificus]WBX72907.1 hypothetical protein PG913_08320 [Tenacibaculum pacificus]
MTPSKEIFIEVQKALKSITKLELIDLDRKQFQKGKENYPGCFTAVLIKMPSIQYQNMTEQIKEGTTTLEIILYCKDGWMEQHQNTGDPNNGLSEIEIIDDIVKVLEALSGKSFTKLTQISEEENEISDDELMSYRISFTSKIYKTVNKKHSLKKLSIKQL